MSVTFGLAAFPWVGHVIPTGTAYFIPLICAFFVIVLLLPGWSERWRSIILSALIGLAFALTLRDIISHALPTRWLTWGVIPVNDAKGFLDNALEFLARGEFYTHRGRIFSPVFYSGLMHLFDLNIHAVMWVCTALAAIATLCVVFNVRSILGFTASGIIAFLLIDFVHEHIGGLSSEIPGYIFGLGAFSAILASVRSGSITSFLIGFILLSTAMAIRVGAVFILPALLVWAWIWLPPLWGRRWLTPLIGTILFIAIFWLNGVATRAIAPASGSAFSNGVDSWYAVIVEGELALGRRSPTDVISQTRWMQIYRDHPEIANAGTIDQHRLKMKFFIEALKRSPDAAVIGALIELKKYIINKDIFNFIDVRPIAFLVFLAAILGGVIAFYETVHIRQPLPALITVTNLAIMASQPFLYGGEHRASTPIIGFIALWPAYGAVVARRWLTARRGKVPSDIGKETGNLNFINRIAIAVCIAGLTVFGLGLTVGGRYGDGRTAHPDTSCPSGTRPLRFHYITSAGLYIGPAKTLGDWPAPSLTSEKLSSTYTWLKNLQGRYRRWIYTPFDMSEAKHLSALRAAEASPEGIFLFHTIDLGNRKPLFAVVSAPPLNLHGPLNACIGEEAPNLIHVQPTAGRQSIKERL